MFDWAATHRFSLVRAVRFEQFDSIAPFQPRSQRYYSLLVGRDLRRSRKIVDTVHSSTLAYDFDIGSVGRYCTTRVSFCTIIFG